MTTTCAKCNKPPQSTFYRYKNYSICDRCDRLIEALINSCEVKYERKPIVTPDDTWGKHVAAQRPLDMG